LSKRRAEQENFITSRLPCDDIVTEAQIQSRVETLLSN
jgi:hypothetical protein